MYTYIISIIYWFLVVVQYVVIAYVISCWIKALPRFHKVMTDIMAPLLKIMRKVTAHSVFRMRGVDISPILIYLLAGYGARLCLVLR